MTATQRWLFLSSVLFVGLALGPGLAHLLALPNKIGLGRDDYFVAQGIYRGWNLLAVVVVGALVSTLGLSLALRRQVPRSGSAWALAAFLCLAGAQALFWIFTYPANVATANWTRQPADWEALRVQWEYSHAAGALLTLAALLNLAGAALARFERTATSAAA